MDRYEEQWLEGCIEDEGTIDDLIEAETESHATIDEAYNKKMEQEAPDGYYWNGAQYLAGNNVECSLNERESWGR